MTVMSNGRRNVQKRYKVCKNSHSSITENLGQEKNMDMIWDYSILTHCL